MIHSQASQVIYPQPSMIHPQSYQVIHPQSYLVVHPKSSQVIHQQASQAPVVSLQSSADPKQVDSSLIAPYFLPTDDPLECFTKALTFMSTILASIYPSSNNQLETLSNPMHQVDMPERQTLSYVDGVELYDSDCDDVPNAQLSFMANISSYGSDALAEVHNPDNMDNNMINHGVHLKPSSEQPNIINHLETEITSDSNIIPYSQYEIESQQTAVQNSYLSAQQDALILSMIEQLKTQNTSAIVIPDFEETLMLAEESHSKMLLKQQDPMMLEKKVNTTPIDYATLNQLSQDFETRFVPQTELSAEQAFWSLNSMNSSEPTSSYKPTKVEVPKELSNVSMVNTSLKKLKYHLC
ncbi:hypothetical protein Tco_1417682 [Tanacetum coccineum]